MPLPPPSLAKGASYVRFLCSGDRFWPFYNFPFFGGREFCFPWLVPTQQPWKTKLKFCSTDLGALAFSMALVGLVRRGMENEYQRCHCHPHWSPTERAMFDSLFWGPILAVLQFPVFGVANLFFRWSYLYGHDGKLNSKFFSPISAPWPSRGLSWVSANAPWKMSATDSIFTPISHHRSELCSMLCSGDRFWPIYHSPFFGWSRI